MINGLSPAGDRRLDAPDQLQEGSPLSCSGEMEQRSDPSLQLPGISQFEVFHGNARVQASRIAPFLPVAQSIPCGWHLVSSCAPEDTSAGVLPPAVTPLALFTDISLHLPPTLLAHHVAAPVILAVASLHHLLRVGVVAAATAHQVATVAAHGGLVALPVKRRMHTQELRERTCPTMVMVLTTAICPRCRGLLANWG